MVSIDLTSNDSGVSGYVSWEPPGKAPMPVYIFDVQTFEGFWGSDGYFDGYGEFAQCYIYGELVSAPEPSSLLTLLAGLGLIGCGFCFGRKQLGRH